jgi:hypothetical protein
MAYSDGLEASQSGFKHTPNVVTLRFVTVCVTEMCLDPGNPVAKSAHSSLDAGVNQRNDRFSPLDVIVRMDLNLHGGTSLA